MFLRGRQAPRTVLVTATLASLLSAAAALTPLPVLAQATGVSRTQSAARPLIAVVSIGRQRLTIYDRNGIVDQTPVSSGRRGFETPQGVFSIIEKKEEHNSNLYDDASMPFMQRITWSGVAFHAGVVPGYPASHGCIRLPEAFAEQFFGMTRLNTRVVVVQDDAAPLPIRHPALFQPQLLPAGPEDRPSEVVAARRAPQPLRAQEPGAPAETPMMLGVRPGKPEAAEPKAPALQAERALLTPAEMLRAKKQTLALKATEATRALEASKLVHKARLADLNRMQRGLAAADVNVKRAEQRLAVADRQIALARTADQMERANLAYLRVLEENERSARLIEDGQAKVARLAADAKAAAEALAAAEKQRAQAVAEQRAADRLAEPISVFVSRKTVKLYIRQGRQAVADMPITIADRDMPIGTHVFTALDSANNGRTVNWTVVGVEPQTSPAPRREPAETRGRGKAAAAQPAAAVASRPGTALAAAALDRIGFTPDALAKITPYVQPGSSLIISDLGPSIEMGQGTDFVVLTKGEEAAYEFMVKYARENRLKPPKRPE